jgi:hypothetical protein
VPSCSTKLLHPASSRTGGALSSQLTIGQGTLLVFAASLQLGCIVCPTDEQMRRCIVSTPAAIGVLLAPDLPTLNTLLAPNTPPPSNVISIPNRTKGRVVDRMFLKRKKLVDPYPANTYDMERDGAIEMVLFEVTEGPQRGSKGWIGAWFLRPDFNICSFRRGR